MSIDDPEKIANASLHQRAALMDEIERLNKEIELLKISRREIIEIDEERVAEIERLNAEIKHLRIIKP